MAEKVLAAVRTAPGKTETHRISHAGHAGRRRSDEDGGRRHLRHRRQAVRKAPHGRSGHHGPRKHRRYRQGRPRVHRPQGLQGRRSCIRRTLCRLHEVPVVPRRRIPPLRKYRLALQSGRHPIRLHLGQARTAPVWRLCTICVSAVECRDPSRAQGRVAGTGRYRHTHGQRHRMVAIRGWRWLQFDRADPGTGTAGPVADGHLQAGWRIAISS